MFLAASNNVGGGFKKQGTFDFLSMHAKDFPLSYSDKDRPKMTAGFRINTLPGLPRITVEDVVQLFKQGGISPTLDTSVIQIDRFKGDFYLRSIMHHAAPNLKSLHFILSSRSFDSTDHLVEGCMEIKS